MATMDRLDSQAIIGLFKTTDNNLLDFDGLEDFLDFEQDEPLPMPDLGVLGADPAVQAPLLAGGLVPTKVEQGDSSAHSDRWNFNRISSNAGMSDAGGESNTQEQHDEGEEEADGARAKGGRGGRATSVSNGNKKRRTRNDGQMEMNRVAQQKYRERKKAEHERLQDAVDMLTAQVATLKAWEVRSKDLEAANQQLNSTVAQQASALQALHVQASSTAAELDGTRASLAEAQAMVGSQSKMILDQHQKLALQEQIIASLKDRLKERIDDAMQHVVPGTVCEKMVAAVQATLYGAKDQAELQDTLTRLPEHLVHEICKNIFQVCKEQWPELKLKCTAVAGGGTASLQCRT